MKRLFIYTFLLLAFAYFASVSAQPATLQRVKTASPITGIGTTSAPISLIGCGTAGRILSWNGSAWVCITPLSVTVTDNSPQGTVTINAGAGQNQDAIRPMGELNTISTASATHHLMLWNGGQHLRVPLTGLADFWLSNSGLTLPDNISDPNESIGRSASIGIGTYSPSANVHQSGTGATYYKSTNTTTGTTATDGFDIGVDASGKAIINQFENLDLGISTNNTERLLVSANGNIKIYNNVLERTPQAAANVGSDITYIGEIQSYVYPGVRTLITFPNVGISGNKHLALNLNGIVQGTLPITISGSTLVTYPAHSLLSPRGYISTVLVGKNALNQLQISIEPMTIQDGQGIWGTPFNIDINVIAVTAAEIKGVTVSATSATPTWTGTPNTLVNRSVMGSIDARGGLRLASRSGAGAYTFTQEDYTVINTGGAATWTVPVCNSTVSNTIYVLLNRGTGAITTSVSHTLVNGTSTSNLPIDTARTIQCNGTTWYQIY